MTKILYTLITIFIFSGTIMAQEARSIVDEINSQKNGQGNVKVLQDDRIGGLLGKYNVVDSTAVVSYEDGNHVKVMGFKIQVFSGNNQSKSKAEAEYRLAQIRKEFPEYESTITYQSPTWLLRTGNFLTQTDADVALVEMKSKFPSFGREMYVVKSIVKRPTL